MYNKWILKSYLALNGKTQNDLAEHLGITKQAASFKVANGSFSREQMADIRVWLEMPDEAFIRCFAGEEGVNEEGGY